jgi:hypothetical protein
MTLTFIERRKWAIDNVHHAGKVVCREAVEGPVDSATAILVGDFVRLDTDDIKVLSTMSDAGTKAQNQEAAHDVFVGVALEASPAGTANNIMIATEGEYLGIDAASATYEQGAFVGPQGTGSAGAVGVADQAVEAVATANLAVGRVIRRGTTVTELDIDFTGVITTGGQQAMV